ncbi:MAG: ATP-binding protein [Propionibacteriaceae bacterium]|nr:ATP-binding protein [Propionibacteriaceae bacterium]
MSTPYALILSPEGRATKIAHELTANGFDELVHVVAEPTVEAALAATYSPVALIILDCRSTPLDDVIFPLRKDPRYANARILSMVGNDGVVGAESSLDRGWVAAFIGLPMTHGLLARHCRDQLSRWMERHGPEPEDGSPRPRHNPPESDLLRDFESSETTRTLELITVIERALGPRPRLRLPAGVRLTRQDVPIDGVYIVLEGEVALTRQVGDETMLFHQDTTGRVVGLLALSTGSRSRFNSTTMTPAVVVHLSTYQLDQALQLEPQVSAILASSAITQLSTRLARSEHLHTERRFLVRRLEKERAELAEALEQLREARLELVTQARFATLGELSAGIAHELNNPVAALIRSTEHLVEDVADLMVTNPNGELIANTVDHAANRGATSTREDRAARRELSRVIRDEELAHRLSAAGVRNPAIAKAATKSKKLADTIELSAKLGTSLRAINLASAQITRLVSSLRSYSRPDETLEGFSVNTSLEDALHLVSHRLRGVELVRDYGDLPGIRARSAQLGQVWTNILVNAADALDGSGCIELRTRRALREVVVTITDDGPGIPAEVLERVFEPRFTTKHGQVRFGLGMGLGIAARFVHGHSGTITIDSAPGRTCVEVRLPVNGPPEDPTQEAS